MRNNESERAVRVAQAKRDRHKSDPDSLMARSARLAADDPERSRAARQRVKDREAFNQRLEAGFTILAGGDSADEVEIDIDD